VLTAPAPNAEPTVNVIATEEGSRTWTDHAMEQAHCSSATVSSAKPAERARDTKLKKMGIPVTVEDPKAGKKQQLL
jgi:hypothetical protein